MARSRTPAAEKAGDQARRDNEAYETRGELREALEARTGSLPDDVWLAIQPSHSPRYDAAELKECLSALFATEWWQAESRDRVRAVFHALGGEFHSIDARYTRIALERVGQRLALSDWHAGEVRRRRVVTDRELMAIGRMALLAGFSGSRFADRHEARAQFFSSLILSPEVDGLDDFRQWLESLSTNFAGTLSASIDQAAAWVAPRQLQLALIDREVQRIISDRKFDELLRDQLEATQPAEITSKEFFAWSRAPASWSEQLAVASKHFGVRYEQPDSYRRAVTRARKSFPGPAARLQDSREEVASSEAELRALTRRTSGSESDT